MLGHHRLCCFPVSSVTLSLRRKMLLPLFPLLPAVLLTGRRGQGLGCLPIGGPMRLLCAVCRAH